MQNHRFCLLFCSLRLQKRLHCHFLCKSALKSALLQHKSNYMQSLLCFCTRFQKRVQILPCRYRVKCAARCERVERAPRSRVWNRAVFDGFSHLAAGSPFLKTTKKRAFWFQNRAKTTEKPWFLMVSQTRAQKPSKNRARVVRSFAKSAKNESAFRASREKRFFFR